MKLCDVNLLLYAYNAQSPHQRIAERWLEERLSGTETFAIPAVVILGFLRISTNPRIFDQPLAFDESFDLVRSWLECPCATVVHPGQRHLDLVRSLLQPLGLAGNLTTDAHLAALAIEHGAELCSADADFSRFPGLRWTNPLAAG